MLDCNTYVITGNPGIIIDPGSIQFLPLLVEDMHKDSIKPEDINIITNSHLHVDHCWANDALKEISGAEIILHPRHKEFYNISVIETTEFFGLLPIELKEDGILGNNELSSGETTLELIPSAGHSPDSICFYDKEIKALICGDVIFNGNTGRADLPGGNANELKQSIERLSRLEIEYLLPGHMDIISGAEEVKSNFQFVKEHVFSWL
jgi:glyoxylase-like metal-dependent hydrolase (beta-lactamase superfamily II)